MKYLLYWFTHNRRILDIDTFSRIHVTTRFPLWVTLFLAVFAVVAAIYMYRRVRNLENRRRRILTTLRALVYIAMLFMVAAPQLRVEGEGRPAGPLPIILDRTDSMSLKDVYDAPRLNAALEVEKALTRHAKKGLGLIQFHYLYGDDVLPWNQEADPSEEAFDALDEETLAIQTQGAQTSIRKSIIDGLKRHRGVYSPGILIIGDGAHNVGELVDPAIAYLEKRNIPGYFIPIGQERPKDIALDHIIGEEIVFVDEKFKCFVSMQQTGFTGRDLEVRATFGSDTVPAKPVRAESEDEMTFPLEHTPKETGIFDLTVQIPADHEELTAENNVVTRKIRVIKDRIRILMIFGTPSWEFRFLQGAFERDRRVEHKVYLESVDPRIFKYKQKRFIEKLPEKKEDLFRNFDMVYISDISMRSLSPQFHEILEEFVVEEGGGLVIISDGTEVPYSLKGTALEKLLPVRIEAPIGRSSFKQEMFKPLSTKYFLTVAEEGQGNPMITFDVDRKRNQEIWDEFPPMFEVCPDAEMKPSGILLVSAIPEGETEGAPAIVYHTYGKGIVLYMGFDSTWRWRKEYGDRYFRDFWGKVVQFMGLPHLLGESAQSRIFLDRLEAHVGDRVVVTGSIRNKDYSPYLADSITATITREAERDLEIELPVVSGRPGIFRASYYPDVEGKMVFRLPNKLNAEPQELEVTKISREFLDSKVDIPLMKGVADKTKGEVFMETLVGSTNHLAAIEDSEGDDEEDDEEEPSAVAAFFRRFWVEMVGGDKDPEIREEERRQEIERKREKRETRLAEIRRDIETDGKNMFEEKKFLDAFAIHVLRTISDQRLPIAIDEKNSLWDTIGLMILALVLLGIEYFLRKRWFLD